jgi:RHS repeat-associated protein
LLTERYCPRHGQNTITFAYDGFSRRISKAVIDNSGTTPVTTTTENLWCGLTLCEQRDSAGNAVARYFPQGEMQSGTAYLYALDQVGSVVAMVKTDGTVAGRTSYAPYGEITSSTGIQPGFAYAGLYHDSTNGLYLATFRAYDPQTGHWLGNPPENSGAQK